MVFLDANIVIYYIEQPPIWGLKATTRITELIAFGNSLAITELIRMECLVGPLKRQNHELHADFQSFFHSPFVNVLPISSEVSELAATIRVTLGYKPLDSLHLAAARTHGCELFLTKDTALTRYVDVPVEELF